MIDERKKRGPEWHNYYTSLYITGQRQLVRLPVKNNRLAYKTD